MRTQAEHRSLVKEKRRSLEFREAGTEIIFRAVYQKRGSYIEEEVKQKQKQKQTHSKGPMDIFIEY